MGLVDKLRKPDWLAELEACLWAALGVLGLAAAAQVARLATRDELHAEVPAREISGEAPGLGQGVAIDADGVLGVVVEDPSTGQVIAHQLTSLPTFLVVVAVLALLLGSVRRARSGGPFDAGVVRRLRVLGVVALAGGIVATLTEMFAEWTLTASILDGSPATSLDAGPAALWLLAGFGFFAVAEIVRRGLGLRTELDTVI